LLIKQKFKLKDNYFKSNDEMRVRWSNRWL